MIQVVWPQEGRQSTSKREYIKRPGQGLLGVAQTSGWKGVKTGTEPPVDKFWEEAEPRWWEAVRL